MHRSRPGATLLLAAVVALATFLAFSPVLRNNFVDWDDQATIDRNPDMNPPTWAGLGRAWSAPAGELYIPVTYTAWAGLAWLAYSPSPRPDGLHLNPGVFHAGSIATHILCTLTVLAILRRLLHADLPAAAGALIFALHPLQAEAVAWASGLKDLLCGLFTLLALLNYLISVEAGAGGRSRRLHYLLATFCFVLALLSKPTAAVAPLLLMCVDVWAIGADWRQSLRRLAPFFVLAAPVVWIGKIVQPGPAILIVPLYTRPAVAIVSLGFYLSKLILPIRLALDYSLPPDRILQHPMIDCLGLLPIALALACMRYRRQNRWLPTAGLAMLIPLLPVIGLVRLSFAFQSGVADHYAYVAMFGVALLAAAALAGFPVAGSAIAPAAGLPIEVARQELIATATHAKIASSRSQAFAIYAVGAAALATFGILTSIQARVWHDSYRLFLHNLDVNPASLAAHRTLGDLYAQQGRTDEAIAQDEAALRTRPNDPRTQYNLGNILMTVRHDPAAAVGHYEAAVASDPTDPRFHGNLAAALESSGRLDEARTQYALEQVLYGNQLLAHGQAAQAFEHFQAAIRLEPTSADALAGLNRAEQELTATGR